MGILGSGCGQFRPCRSKFTGEKNVTPLNSFGLGCILGEQKFVYRVNFSLLRYFNLFLILFSGRISDTKRGSLGNKQPDNQWKSGTG
jgi:hypothetical protein